MIDIIDNDLGLVHCRLNLKAKRIIVRYRDGVFNLSYPSGIGQSEIESALKRLKPRLLAMRERTHEKIIFSPSNGFEAFSFRVAIHESACDGFYVTCKYDLMDIVCPVGTNYTNSDVQQFIRNHIESKMRIDSKLLFPQMLQLLAVKFGFRYHSLKINKSRSRWGSCSSKGNINLSYFMLLLPSHLIQFVMLHELCHTREMNHGEKFWKHLDSVTDNKAKELTSELKKIKIPW